MTPKNRRKPTSSSSSGNRSSFSTTITEAHLRVETHTGGNHYQFKGPKPGFEYKAVKEDLYLRIDMPGVFDDGVVVQMEGTELFFSGEAHPLTDFEDRPNRVYGGCIDLSSNSGQISEMKTSMKNGVLRIVLVGCDIKPDLSDREPLWRPGFHKLRPTPPSKLVRREISLVGDYLLGFRSESFLDPPDESTTGLYPFQLSGPLGCYENKQVWGNHLFMRVDVPDVPSDGLTVKFRDNVVRDNVVFWEGKGVKCSEDEEEEVRGYFSKHQQTCGCCNYVLIRSEVKSGVFTMLLEMKKIKPASESADATGNTESSQKYV